MTSFRWDNVPKPRVERPPLLAPGSKSARREQKLPDLRDRIEEAGGAQFELKDLARSARAAARATSAKMRSDRCSACKARGVTLWQIAGRLVCARCRTANEMAYAPQSGRRQEPGHRKAARKEGTVTVATAEKDIAWAARQGRQDRKALTQCGSYKSFLKRYNLRRSEKAWEMWTEYHRSSRQAPATIQPRSPSPGKCTRPSRSSALSDERLARLRDLQRKLNPPEAIRDAWR
jgi:uncharacterized Zn finger protein (UPF0148 family)